jgi:hypothetical protein
MRADLRTRVELVIDAHNMRIAKPSDRTWTCRCGAKPDNYSGHLADVVMHELGLRPERKEAVKAPSALIFTRYVTDWKAEN